MMPIPSRKDPATKTSLEHLGQGQLEVPVQRTSSITVLSSAQFIAISAVRQHTWFTSKEMPTIRRLHLQVAASKVTSNLLGL